MAAVVLVIIVIEEGSNSAEAPVRYSVHYDERYLAAVTVTMRVDHWFAVSWHWFVCWFTDPQID